MSVTTAIALDKRRAVKSGGKSKKELFNACIRVTHERNSRYYPTGVAVTEQMFKSMSAPNAGGRLRV